MTRSIGTFGVVLIAAFLGYNAVLATPAPIVNPLNPRPQPRQVPGVDTFFLCDAVNITGNCFHEFITPATLGTCIDFSGDNAFLAGGGLKSVLAPQGFTLLLASEHNCVFTQGTSFSLEGGVFNIAQIPQSFVSSVAVVE